MSESPRRYLTTPIYYASGEPHIGHAYTTFLADTLARYHRQCGARVFFLTGTDEYGQKIQEEAAKRGVEPQQLCDEMATRFASAWKEMDIEYDRFIRTTEKEHRGVVRAFLTRLNAKGFIYDALYSGWYCIHFEGDLHRDAGTKDKARAMSVSETATELRFGGEVMGAATAGPIDQPLKSDKTL